MHPPLPVICDRCRAEGMAGDEAFAGVADILAFDPVPRRPHADGWTPEYQRAFIAALALTGSPRRAGRAIGKHAFGAEQLRKARGGRSFSEAWDAAMDIARERELHRLHGNLAGLAAEQAELDSPGRPRFENDEEARERAGREELFRKLLRLYTIKVTQERKARLAGEVVAADFYLRQISFFEVAIDLSSRDAFKALEGLRRGGYGVLDIAETDMSRLLDELRRELWEQQSEPPRPEHPPRRYLVAHDGFRTEPTESYRGGPVSLKEQEEAFRQRHREDAKKQVEWEAEARRDYERRREAAPLIGEEPGSAGRPAAEADRTDVSAPAPRAGAPTRSDADPGPETLEAGRPAPLGDRTDVTNSLRDGAGSDAAPSDARPDTQDPAP